MVNKYFTLALSVLLLVSMTLGSVDLIAMDNSAKKDGPQSIEEKLEKLHAAADEGNSEAHYYLGMIYMQPDLTLKADKKVALFHFKQVEGKFKIAALIMTGTIHAEGYNAIQPDLIKAEKIFQEAFLMLNKDFEEIKLLASNIESESKENIELYLKKSGQFNLNNNMLLGATKKYGIEIEGLMK